MASYRVSLRPSAEKDLRRLSPDIVARVAAHINRLITNPFPSQVVKLKEPGSLYRIRVGDYRVVYEVDAKASLIVVHYVRHRREVYRGL